MDDADDKNSQYMDMMVDVLKGELKPTSSEFLRKAKMSKDRIMSEIEHKLPHMKSKLDREIISGTYMPHLTFLLHNIYPTWAVTQYTLFRVEYYELMREAWEEVYEIEYGEPVDVYLTGSMAQNLHFNRYLSYNYHSNQLTLQSDLDFMITAESWVCRDCVTIDSNSTKPCYVRLQHTPHPSEKCILNSETHVPLGANTYIKNTMSNVVPTDGALCTIEACDGEEILASKSSRRFQSISGPASTSRDAMFKSTGFFPDVDSVNAIHCPHWPAEAMEWCERKRISQWPSADLIKSITSQGCHIVPVAHKTSSRPDIEWRLSFVLAENELAEAMSLSHRQCFLIFKLLVTYVTSPSTVLSSYWIKNIMFRAMEIIPLELWDEQITGLGRCFLFLLDELIHCLSTNELPHYFIPANNLLEGKPRPFLRDLMRDVSNLRKSPIHYLVKMNDTFVADHSIQTKYLKPILVDVESPNATSLSFSFGKLLSQLTILNYYPTYDATFGFESLHNELREDEFHNALTGVFQLKNVPAFLYLCHDAILQCSNPSAKCALAWSIFLTYKDDMNELHQNIVSSLFSTTLSKPFQGLEFVRSSIFYALFLRYYGRTHEAIETTKKAFERVSTFSVEDNLGMRGHVWFCSNAKPVLDTFLQQELDWWGSRVIPAAVMVIHLLISCTRETPDCLDDALGLLGKLEMYTAQCPAEPKGQTSVRALKDACILLGLQEKAQAIQIVMHSVDPDGLGSISVDFLEMTYDFDINMDKLGEMKGATESA